MWSSFSYFLLELCNDTRKGSIETCAVCYFVLELLQNNRDESLCLIALELWFLYHSMSYAVADIG